MKPVLNIKLMAAAFAALLFVASPCAAGEQAVLRNGFAIEHERRVAMEDGRVTRLFLTSAGDSFVDIATTEISSFEKVEKAPELGPLEKTAMVGGARLSRAEIGAIVEEASGQHQIDPDLIRSVIQAESRFNTNAVSKKGARGLMQLMPATAEKLGVSDSFDARANVMGGTRYLRDLLGRYNNDMVKALAAYNAGPQRVQQYQGVPPYRETRVYVAQIVRDFNRAKMAERKAARAEVIAQYAAKLASAAAAHKQTAKSNVPTQ